MKKKYIFGIVSLAIATSLTGCMDNFAEFNKDPNSIYVDNLSEKDLQKMVLSTQYAIYPNDVGMYQYGYNLHIDLFAGYFCTPHTFGDNSNMFYKLRPDFNHGPLEILLLKVIPNTNAVIKFADQKEMKNYASMARVMQVIAANNAVDTYGPIPYTSVISGEDPYYYDTEETVYKSLFADLRKANEDLRDFMTANPNAKTTNDFDKMCNESYENWRKLVGSVHLRLAMRLVKINPDLAKEETKYVLENGIYFNENDKDIEVVDETIQNPMYWMDQGWGDSRMNASFESMMKGYKHPAIMNLFTEVDMDNFKDKDGNAAKAYDDDPYPTIHAVRMGVEAGVKPNNPYGPMSGYKVDEHEPLPIFKVCETQFLLAEIAMRWPELVQETPHEFYEKGVRCALANQDITDASAIDTYLAGTTNAYRYKDIYDDANSTDRVNDVPVKWLDGNDNEKHLQQIITQKWIGTFPLSFNAWAEFRRTGYPKLFTVANNKSDGLIDTEEQIRRLPFTLQERNTNGSEVKKAESLLNGPDTGGTRIWWDVEKGNF